MNCCGLQMSFHDKEYQLCQRCQKWKKSEEKTDEQKLSDILRSFGMEKE